MTLQSGASLFRLSSVEGARVRVVCFPHAGGTVFAYQPWAEQAKAFYPDAEFWALQLLSGPFPNFWAFTSELARIVSSTLAEEARSPRVGGLPVVLLGHSLGGLLAFGAACRLRELEGVDIAGLCIVGTTSPFHLGNSGLPGYQTWNRDEWLKYLVHIGGTARNILDSESRIEELIQQVRDECTLRTSYCHREEQPFPFPISVHFGNDELRELSPASILDWQKQTLAGLTLHSWPGGHFFLHEPENRRRMLLTISDELSPLHDVA